MTARLADHRTAWVSLLAVFVGIVGAFVSKSLVWLIQFITSVVFYGRWPDSNASVSPAGNHLGLFVIGVPMIGGLLVGLMARYGSKAIRGHGIPEAMERVLLHESRIPARIFFLKPLSAALAIGTGGPFGAEGPIIATGGAMGSLLGQLLRVNEHERKVLLAAGAAAGMSAVFGTPMASVLIAVELLLFEWKPRSLIPVSLAAGFAAAGRGVLSTSSGFFHLPHLEPVAASSLFFYLALGAGMGFISIAINRVVYAIEDGFEHSVPIHWMFWPVLGGAAVGAIGYVSPATLGVGYENIDHALSAQWASGPLLVFCVCKFISWSISLSSGTSGGTLAPLMTIGGGLGSVASVFFAERLPFLRIDPHAGALVGMTALFGGCSRTLLMPILFAMESTQDMNALLPLLCGCTLSYAVACSFAEQSIMTEKIARRGVKVPVEYHPA